MLGHFHLVENSLEERHHLFNLGGELPSQLTKLGCQGSIIELPISTPEGGQWVGPELRHVSLEVATPRWVVLPLGQAMLLLLEAGGAGGETVAMHPWQLGVVPPEESITVPEEKLDVNTRTYLA